jgi:hypothetical protein
MLSGNITPPLSPPRRTASPADPPQKLPGFVFWPPKSLIFKIFGTLLAEPKTHKKTHPFKTLQNLKKLNNGRPKARFWSLFGTIWAPIFHQIS